MSAQEVKRAAATQQASNVYFIQAPPTNYGTMGYSEGKLHFCDADEQLFLLLLHLLQWSINTQSLLKMVQSLTFHRVVNMFIKLRVSVCIKEFCSYELFRNLEIGEFFQSRKLSVSFPFCVVV